MNISTEDFAAYVKLSTEEYNTLRQILDDIEIEQTAYQIVKECFTAANPQYPAHYPENAKLAQAWFAACYLAADFSWKTFQDLGFPHSVWAETLTDIGIWLRHEKRNTGTIGLGKKARMWEVSLMRGEVTRHGRLECNSKFIYHGEDRLDESGKPLLSDGTPLINIHIPEDGPMDMTSCGYSMKRMAEFFARYRKNYCWQGFVCESWLLDRQLQKMLPETSNIVNFQKLGKCFILAPTEDTIFRIFGSTPPDKVQNPSTLQRNAAEFIRNGGTFYSELLFIPRANIESVDFDLEKLLQRNN